MKKGDKGYSSALYVWNGFSLFWGTSFNTSPHYHNTLQLVFDIDRSFLLKDKNSEWKEYSSAIINTGHIHQLNSNGSIQLFVYLDKDSLYAKQLVEKYLHTSGIDDLGSSAIGKLEKSFFKKLLLESDCTALFSGCHTILKHLIELAPTCRKDERVDRAIAYISRSHGRPFRIKDIADHVCLSESRLRHLFKEHTGQPLQSYILWMKVVSSLGMVLKGVQVDESAYASGFWDASHMSKSYKELLGVTPGSIKQYEDVIRIVPCGDKSLYTFKTGIFNSWDADSPGITIKT